MKSCKEIVFPRRDVQPATVFTKETLARLTAYLWSWNQGPGIFGGLHLHPCWMESSVLQRRYQGQTTFMSYGLMRGARYVPGLAGELVDNLLALQSAAGGFIHAAAENEPATDCHYTCPIHQALPILALLSQARGPRRDEIRAAVDRHWAWFHSYGWQRGKYFMPHEKSERLNRPGWCGVTNQDLAVVAALALYGKEYGDFSRYEQFGKPALEAYLGPSFYDERRGLLERGDRPHFCERTRYYDIIVEMLEIIHECTGDARLPGVMLNIAQHLRDAVFTDVDGFAQLAWGYDGAGGWIRDPVSFSALPALIGVMHRHGVYTADLEQTLAAYVFDDGTIPSALGADPLFAIVPNSDTVSWWVWLLEKLQSAPIASKVPVIRRRCGDLVWKSGPRAWVIERDGQRLFAGMKQCPSSMAVGSEALTGMEPNEFDACDADESLSMRNCQ